MSIIKTVRKGHKLLWWLNFSRQFLFSTNFPSSSTSIETFKLPKYELLTITFLIKKLIFLSVFIDQNGVPSTKYTKQNTLTETKKAKIKNRNNKSNNINEGLKDWKLRLSTACMRRKIFVSTIQKVMRQ